MAKTMTQEYSDLINGTIFTPKVFKDVTNSLASKIQTVKNYIISGQSIKAEEYIQSLSPADISDISSANFSAKDINALEEETRNIEILAIEGCQSIFYSPTMPPAKVRMDVWIGDE